MRLCKREDNTFRLYLSIGGRFRNLVGTIYKDGNDAEGDIQKSTGANGKFGITGKQEEDGELVYPAVLNLKRMKFNDDLIIIAPEKNTPLQFKRDLFQQKFYRN